MIIIHVKMYYCYSSADAVATLEIHRVSEEDLGLYMCSASNLLGNSSADLEVTGMSVGSKVI